MKHLVAALAAFLLLPRPAHAQDECEARIARAQAALERDAVNGRLHGLGWSIGYGTATAGAVGLALYLDDEGKQAEQWVGAGKSFLGLLTVLLKPVLARDDAPAFRARLEESGMGRCRLAEEGERLVARNAKDQAFARSWLAHLGTVAANGGGLLIVGFGYDRWLTGSLAAAVGIVVGEAQIFTRPTASLRAHRETGVSLGVAPLVGETTGLAVFGTF